jgi:hypothetical protein
MRVWTTAFALPHTGKSANHAVRVRGIRSNQRSVRIIREIFWIARENARSHYRRAIRSHGFDRNVVVDLNAKAFIARSLIGRLTPMGRLRSRWSQLVAPLEKKLNGALGSLPCGLRKGSQSGHARCGVKPMAESRQRCQASQAERAQTGRLFIFSYFAIGVIPRRT